MLFFQDFVMIQCHDHLYEVVLGLAARGMRFGTTVLCVRSMHSGRRGGNMRKSCKAEKSCNIVHTLF